MAYVISDSCVSCGTCEPECPVGAISQGTASSKSMDLLVLNVAHAQVFVLQVLSLRSNP